MAIELKNTSQKVIIIGKETVLPDDVIEISEQQAEQPSIKAFIKHGYVSVSKKRCAEHIEKPAEEVKPADVPAPAKPPADVPDPAGSDVSAETESEAEKSYTGKRGRNK